MLRASTLGLSLPLPNILAVRSCRQLSVAQNRCVYLLPCGVTSSTKSSFLTATNSTQLTPTAVIQLASFVPVDAHQQQREQEEKNIIKKDCSLDLQLHTREVAGNAAKSFEGANSSPLPVVYSKEMWGADCVHPRTTSQASLTGAMPPRCIKALEGEMVQFSSSTQERRKNGNGSQTQVITTPPAYAAGKPWSFDSVKPVAVPRRTLHLLKNIEVGIRIAHEKFDQAWRSRRRRTRSASAHAAAASKAGIPSRNVPSLLHKHFDILGTTASVDQAWDSYVFLIDTIASHEIIYSRLTCIPYSHLHRFSRLLAHNRPRTYVQYLRLLSVMTYIVHCGGVLKREQWNALIALATSGRRKTTTEDIDKAMAIFRGMKTGRLPGSPSFKLPDDYEDQTVQSLSPLEPDVYTLTTLLTIACRAMDAAALKSIASIMTKAGLSPSRITHLSLLRYFTYKKDLGGVRRTLQKMRHQGLEVGLDGLNACIWAYGYNNRLEIALLIYRVLRHNQIPETYLGPDDIHDAVMSLKAESIIVDPGITPNHITYTTVIQTLAYHGHFEPSVKIFIDMLSMNNTEQGAPLLPSETGDLIPAPYAPSMAVYRAVFLGFAKNGIPPHLNQDHETPDWTLDNLKEIFERFLTLPEDTLLTHSILDIIMSAFAKTSGNDLDEMRRAWEALDHRFEIAFRRAHSESRLARLQRKLFPDDLSEPE